MNKSTKSKMAGTTDIKGIYQGKPPYWGPGTGLINQPWPPVEFLISGLVNSNPSGTLKFFIIINIWLLWKYIYYLYHYLVTYLSF